MIEPFLKARLEPLARRRRRWNMARALAVCWGSGALVALGFVLLFRSTGWQSAWVLPAICLGTLGAIGAAWLRQRRAEPDYRELARQVEQRNPDLHALLLTAVEQKPDSQTGKFNFLQERLLREAVDKSVEGDWLHTITSAQMGRAQAVQWGGLFLFLAALASLRAPKEAIVATAAETKVNVSPGNTVIERGTGLAILARFEGALPAQVTLVVRPDGQPERQVPLVKSLNDPLFGGTIPEITNALSYRVDYGTARSADFTVKVFEYPRLERADAHVTFPSYTGLPEKRVEDTRRVSAVEGSSLDLALQLNKPVAEARLVAKDKSVIPLGADTNRANASLNHLTLTNSQIYDLVLVDAEGRTNKVPTQIVVEVVTNRIPELKFNFPRGDQRVSPLQEVTFQGEVWDDFGIQDHGITYSLAGGKPQTISFGTVPIPREKRQFTHLLSLENLSAQPDQLLSYFIWADDLGPDGKVRRSASDMYYAEVRPFEELFREGQAPPAGEGEQGSQNNEMLKLAELQKQIINATWKLQRQANVGLNADAGADKTPVRRAAAPAHEKDIKVVEQSQEEALKQASEKKEESQNARTKALWDTVEKQMENAAEHLGKASQDLDALPLAVASEQAAYQALLKLASREKQVVQGRRNQGASGGQNQQELDQLDLKQAENKYENQKQAAANKQNPEQREQNQILSRLKELSQRQQDLNERLKELQNALQEAKTDQERDEIRRRLKRLREEEQQMLADTDELLQRMDRPENQAQMANARQQLENTRNQIQRASEMIEKEAVGQALSSGTRAQRELQDLREDLRKKNSAQFAEEMRQMRTDARDLAQKEDQISDKLKALAANKPKTLSDSPETTQLQQQLGAQTEKMTNLLDNITRVSQEAEASEPLLAKQLYDTLRKASQGNADQSLQRARELLKLNFPDEAGQFEQRARKEIVDVKQGVERAAESVLGDETEALRLARRELDELSRQLEKELAKGDPGSNKPQSEAGNAQASAGTKPQNLNQPGDQASAAAGQNGNRPEQGENARPGRSAPGQNRTGEEPNSENGKELAQAGNSSRQGNRPGEEGQQPGTQGQGQGEGQEQRQQGQGQGQAQTQGQGQGQQQEQAQAQGQGQGQGQGQAQANAEGARPGQGQGGNGQPPQGGNPRDPGRPRQRPSLAGQPGQNERPVGQRPGSGQAQARNGNGGGEGGGDRADQGPITGEGYADWSDRLRDVEEMLDLPDLRNEVAGVRERARAMRSDFKKKSKPPQWDVVRGQIAEPLAEVRNRISEELARRESKDSLVPIDRDPVPQKFSELVKRYYERLGSSKEDSPTRQ